MPRCSRHFEAGACGYILKDTQPQELIDGIRQTARGQVVLSREVARILVEHASPNNHSVEQAQAANDRPALTAREQDVLRLIVEGADNAAIGLELSMAEPAYRQAARDEHLREAGRADPCRGRCPRRADGPLLSAPDEPASAISSTRAAKPTATDPATGGR